MDEPVKGADGELGAFGELLADPLAEDAYEQLLDHSEIEQVRALLGSLNDRERIDPARSLRARRRRSSHCERSASGSASSGERVRQIENRALGKLRAATSVVRAPSET